MDFSLVRKLLILGDSGVGKTSILQCFDDQEFCEAHISTIGIDFMFKNIKYKDLKTKKKSEVRLQIWDTAGQERFRTITNAYFRGANGIMVVYDVTSTPSFNHVHKWMKDISNMAPLNVPVILIANKADNNRYREISKEDGEVLAEHYNIPFFEVSARSGLNVELAFNELIKMLMEQKEEYERKGITLSSPNKNRRIKCCNK